MENYGNAQKYAEVATSSSGTATEKYNAYLDSLEGKMSVLTATFESFSQTVLNSEWIITGVELLTGFVSVLNSIASIGNGSVIAIIAIATAIGVLVTASDFASAKIKKLILDHAALSGAQVGTTVTTKAFTAALGHMVTTGILGAITAIPRLIFHLIAWTAQYGFATVAALGFKGALELLEINPFVIGITAAIAAIAAIAAAFKSASDAAKNYNAQQQQIINATYETTANLKAEREELDELISSYYELAEANQGVYDASEREKILEIQEKINSTIDDEISKVNLLGASYGNLKETMSSLHSVQLSAVQKSIQAEKDSIDIIKESVGYTPNSYETVHWGSGQYSEGAVAIDTGASLREFVDNLKTAKEIYVYSQAGKIAFDNAISKYESALSSIAYHMEEISALQLELSHVNFLKDGGGGDNGIIDTPREYVDLKESIAEALGESEDFVGTQDEINAAVERFVQSEYPEIYNEIATNVTHANYQLKEFSDLVDGTTGSLDALTTASEEMASSGALSLDTVKKLKELNLDNYLERTENGFFKLNGSIEDLKTKKINELVKIMKSNEFSVGEDGIGNDAYENAKSELQDLIAIFNTYELNDKIEEETKRLEEQLETFEEMVDLRKEVLQTYKKELDYQKELEKKETRVAELRTQLAVSQLDDSVYGVSKTRELEEELAEAEEDLEDFTLEHAIEVLTAQLDAQKQEYSNFIGSKIDTLAKELTGSVSSAASVIKTAFDTYVDSNNEAASNNATNELQTFINNNGVTSVDDLDAKGGSGLYTAAKEAYEKTADKNGNQNVWQNSLITWHTPPEQEPYNPYHYYSNVSLDTESGPDDGEISGADGDNFVLKVGDAKYHLQMGYGASPDHPGLADDAVRSGGGTPTAGSVIKSDAGYYYVRAKDGKWYEIERRDNSYKDDYKSFTNSLAKYHTGGLVGDVSTLSTSEEFAKLLKGEFVSTPAQMKRFIETTLPSIANYATTSGGNEFNAPLVEINCGSITTESLPDMKQIVNDAVNEVRRILDSGMRRTGYKKLVKTI